MMARIIILTMIMNLNSPAFSQSLPLKEWSSAAATPFVFYLSGDGGINSFSTSLCTNINSGGYSIAALNSQSYFRDKKIPEQTAQAISNYVEAKLINRENQELVIIGYSFGADVLSFVVNRLPAVTKKRLKSVVLVSPSTSTDFQVHWSDMFGGDTKRSMDVLQEINHMSVARLTTFFGNDEHSFPAGEISVAHQNHVLPGGHKYDGHVDQLSHMILESIR